MKTIKLMIIGMVLIMSCSLAYAQWTNGDDEFGYRRGINITVDYAVWNLTINVTLDTATLITAGKMNANCSDINILMNNTFNLSFSIEGCNTAKTRIFYKTNKTNSSEIDYIYYGQASPKNTYNISVEDAQWVTYENFKINKSIWKVTVQKFGTDIALATIAFDPVNGGGAWLSYSGNTGAPAVYRNWTTKKIYGFYINMTARMISGTAPCLHLGGFHTTRGVLGTIGCSINASGIAYTGDSSTDNKVEVGTGDVNSTINNNAFVIRGGDVPQRIAAASTNITYVIEWRRHTNRSNTFLNYSVYNASGVPGSASRGRFLNSSNRGNPANPEGSKFQYEVMASGSASSGRNAVINVTFYQMKFAVNKTGVLYLAEETKPSVAVCSQCSDISDGDIDECKGKCINFDCNMLGNRVRCTGGGDKIRIKNDFFNYPYFDQGCDVLDVGVC